MAPGIYLYEPPFPTSNDAAGGCGKVDVTGAPLADAIQKSLFIANDGNIPTPNAIIASPNDTFYISSVINGVIAEYDQQGRYVRRILEPPSGETLGPEPYSTGSPFGLGIDSAGTVYYADIGIVLRNGRHRPGTAHRHGAQDPLRRRRPAAAGHHGHRPRASPTASASSRSRPEMRRARVSRVAAGPVPWVKIPCRLVGSAGTTPRPTPGAHRWERSAILVPVSFSL